MTQPRYQYIAMFIILSAIFTFTIWRDVQIEHQYTGDLRNRIVGARLQMDGKLPYFYKWHPQDGLRYYDPIKLDTTYANAITASPFFHHLLYPIANLPQRQISRIWLGIEYLLFFIGVLMAFSFTENITQRWAITFVGALFLFSQSWLTLISCGQNYIFFPPLAFLFLLCFQKKGNLFLFLFAGIAASVLLLSRPTSILFFLPFLLLWKQYSFRHILIFSIPIIIFFGYSVINKDERNFWIDYRKGIAAHVKDHQSDDRMARTIAFEPVIYQEWEGWNQDSIDKAAHEHPIHLLFENGGVKQIVKYFLHKKIPSAFLAIGCTMIILLLSIAFFFKQKNDSSVHVATFAIFGFCLYMISDFFSPVLRMPYYGVQWLFPLLLCASLYNHRLRLPFFLLCAGILLNIWRTPRIPMRNTLGEYLILVTLLWICLSRRYNLVK